MQNSQCIQTIPHFQYSDMFYYRSHENGKTPQARIKKYSVNEFEVFVFGFVSILHGHKSKIYFYFVIWHFYLGGKCRCLQN